MVGAHFASCSYLLHMTLSSTHFYLVLAGCDTIPLLCPDQETVVDDNLYAFILIVVKWTAPTTKHWGGTTKATHDRRATRRKKKRRGKIFRSI